MFPLKNMQNHFGTLRFSERGAVVTSGFGRNDGGVSADGGLESAGASAAGRDVGMDDKSAAFVFDEDPAVL
jgi:hypothetical protein